MIKLWLIFSTLAVSNLFLVFKDDREFIFPVSGFVAPINSVVYFTYEHIGLIILAGLILFPPTEHRYMYKLFLMITCVDMLFFLLYYKSPSLWNPLKCLIFGAPLLYEQWKHLEAQFHK